MNDHELRGLIGAVGKTLARRAHADGAADAIEHLGSPRAFRAFLESVDLGLAEPSRSGFIDRVTGDRWRDYRSQIATSTNQQYHELTAPGE